MSNGATASDELVVDVRGLVKTFGSTRALDGLDLEVRRGEVHGFLGPNGAGKTTTLRILLGLVRADAGVLRLLGGDPWRDVSSLHQRLAYVPGDLALWPNLTGGEVIDLLSRIQGQHDVRRRNRYLELFNLDPSKKCRAYSRGNRQKVALVSALASSAEVFFLDEPTAGLDPIMEATFRTCVREIRDQGRTVLLSSHILSEAEALSDRVTIIKDGRVVESGPLDALRHLTSTTVKAEVTRIPSGLDEIDGVHDLVIEGQRITAQVEERALGPLMKELGGVGISSLTSQPPTLEELFLRHYAPAGSVRSPEGGDAIGHD